MWSRLPKPLRWACLLLPVLLAAAFVFEGIHAPDTDLFQHMASGRGMVEAGRILDRETFSFTIPGRDWVNYSWLFQVVVYGVHEWTGLRGLVIFRAVIVLLTAGMLSFWLGRTGKEDPGAAGVIGGLAMALYLPRALNLRPHLFSYLFLAWLPLLLDRFAERKKYAGVGIVLLCALWGNVHGVEYPIALAVVGAYGLATRLAANHGRGGALRWLFLLGGCVLGFLLNPFGYRLFLTPLIVLDSEIMGHIPEMRPYLWRSLFTLTPPSTLFTMVPFNYLGWAGIIGMIGWIRRRDWREMFFFAWPVALVFFRIRFAAEFAILSAPYIARGVGHLRGRTGVPGGIAAAVAAIYLVVVSALTMVTHIQGGRYRLISDELYPVGAVAYMRREGLRGNLLCSPTVAGYVEWELGPTVRVAMDMRTPEPFDADIAREVTSIRNGEALRRFVERWDVDLLLLGRGSALAREIGSGGAQGFRRLYESGRFVVYGRS